MALAATAVVVAAIANVVFVVVVDNSCGLCARNNVAIGGSYCGCGVVVVVVVVMVNSSYDDDDISSCGA